jgi:hypothetical protein
LERPKRVTRLLPTLEWFERSVSAITDNIPKPVETLIGGFVAYRYRERSLQQALLLKLVRYVSLLSAGRILAKQGHFQELGIIQRSLDEISEDILFLALPLYGGKSVKDQSRYLASFWEEEPHFDEFSSNQKNRDQVPRRTIRAYLSTFESDADIDHRGIAVSAYLSRMYSGYVHSAAPHIMDQYDPEKQDFRVRGFPDSPLSIEHFQDFENQFFRGVICVHIVAISADAAKVAQEAFAIHERLAPQFHSS